MRPGAVPRDGNGHHSRIPTSPPTDLAYFDPATAAESLIGTALAERPGRRLVSIPARATHRHGRDQSRGDRRLCATREDPAASGIDYSGTGSSGGDFADGTLTSAGWRKRWRRSTMLTEGPLIVAGSSMGGWLALHAAMTPQEQGRRPCSDIAAAPDFTD